MPPNNSNKHNCYIFDYNHNLIRIVLTIRHIQSITKEHDEFVIVYGIFFEYFKQKYYFRQVPINQLIMHKLKK